MPNGTLAIKKTKTNYIISQKKVVTLIRQFNKGTFHKSAAETLGAHGALCVDGEGDGDIFKY